MPPGLDSGNNIADSSNLAVYSRFGNGYQLTIVLTESMPVHLLFIPGVCRALLQLSIPVRHRDGVAGLAAMPNDAFTDFSGAIEKGLSADSASDLAAQLVKVYPSLREQTGLENIIAAIASMLGIYNDAHVSPVIFAKDVADALAADAPILAKKVDLKVLSERIARIANGKRIEITEEKIRSIQVEVERQYCCGRILTDVRAAFADDPSVPPTAMTILHTLRIGYFDDSAEHREFYLALDNDDLSKLRELIDRALIKSKTLEALLAKAECRLFE